jgi:hypothetical protein
MRNGLPCFSETLVATVSASVTVLDGIMAEVVQTHPVEERITPTIKNIDFGWIVHLVVCFTNEG